MTHRLFLYGTLCDPELFQIVAGHPLGATVGRLRDHKTVWADGESFPLIVAAAGEVAEGLLVEVSDDAKARLDFYELGFHYSLQDLPVETGDASIPALVYFPAPGAWAEGAPWSLAAWQHEFGEMTREAAIEYMRLMATHSPAEAAAAFPQIRMRATSRVRARKTPSPLALAPQMSVSNVVMHDSRQPYTKYFAVQEDDLQFPTFAGGLSAKVNRASFLGGDAVTVLPYDPRLDKVLVIRQFRYGVFTRGDTNPWTLEPAAGRIDPDETPEEAVDRELREETGLAATSLHPIANYYPSPSAYSEFLFSYVAVADLSEQDGKTGGLDTEHEDIMSHVISFDQLMEFIDTGAANTGPLVLSALWLSRHRKSLQSAH